MKIICLLGHYMEPWNFLRQNLISWQFCLTMQFLCIFVCINEYYIKGIVIYFLDGFAVPSAACVWLHISDDFHVQWPSLSVPSIAMTPKNGVELNWKSHSTLHSWTENNSNQNHLPFCIPRSQWKSLPILHCKIFLQPWHERWPKIPPQHHLIPRPLRM